MKIFRQTLIILSISLCGEFLSKFFALPVPGNIIGMLLLLFLLMSKIIKLEAIETVSNFFLDHLAFFFIPAGVKLMSSFNLIKDDLLNIFLLCIITTILVIIFTGKTVDFILNKKNKGMK